MNVSTEKLKPSFDELLKIYKFNNSTEKVHGYLVKSTAPINVEDKNDTLIPTDCLEYFEDKHTTNSDKTSKRTKSNISSLNELANFFIKPESNSSPSKIDPNEISNIAKILADANNPEVVIKIHGYSSKEGDVIKQYYEVLNDIKKLNLNKTYIFLGYRWPSESPSFKLQNITSTFNALPILLRWILGGSLVGIGISVILLLFQLYVKALFIFLGTFSIMFSIITTLVLLRVSAYFRDSYRANNYAASDLVELIRELDKAIAKKENSNKIKLSFIAHSMGCYVTTNTIRILSDVFETNNENISNIGKCFALGRLILIAPDIPVETIIPRRANFLQASLRCFQESYIFSNEGDVVLRIASTAANYFSFPAKDRFGGYRLGNITVLHDTQKSIPYGIINLESESREPFDLLGVRSSNQEQKTLQGFWRESANKKIIANKFTYFDCTDYKDENNVTPVSLATKKQALGLWGYTRLLIDHFILGKIDTHGGYFNGNFTKELIHKLAFLGFDGLLNFPSPDKRKEALLELSGKCEAKQIQVLVSKDKQI